MREKKELEDELEECKVAKLELFKYFLIGIVITNSISIILVFEYLKN